MPPVPPPNPAVQPVTYASQPNPCICFRCCDNNCGCCLPAGDCQGMCADPVSAFSCATPYTSAKCCVGASYVGLGILGVVIICCCVYHTWNSCSDCFPSKAPTQMMMRAVDPASLVGAEKGILV